jgi:class 3 adenylate cyclase
VGVADERIPGVTLRDLGEHRLKDLDHPERLAQLLIEGLESESPPLRAPDEQVQLRGTATVVLADARGMLRLSQELGPEQFGALLIEYQRVLCQLFERMGGREVTVCEHLCRSAERGEILLSRAASALLEDEDLGGAILRDLGERPIRGSSSTMHAYELVLPG